MREIKFRGFSKEIGKWVFGNIIKRKCDGYDRTYIYNSDADETEINEYSQDSKYVLKDLFIPIISESVGRYIGLYDIDGKEIYEGDIVKFCYGGVNLKGVIRYVIDRFLIDATIHYSLANNFELKDIKVIGNTYENPDFLAEVR